MNLIAMLQPIGDLTNEGHLAKLLGSLHSSCTQLHDKCSIDEGKEVCTIHAYNSFTHTDPLLHVVHIREHRQPQAHGDQQRTEPSLGQSP
jgi:hypothetical protein